MEKKNSNFVETLSADIEAVFDEKSATMIETDDSFYNEVAGRLLAEIGADDYFCGSVESRYGEIDWHLTATLLIYRNSDSAPYDLDPITDIAVVWWEFHTYTPEEGEILNDFSFTTLKTHLIQPNNAAK